MGGGCRGKLASRNHDQRQPFKDWSKLEASGPSCQTLLQRSSPGGLPRMEDNQGAQRERGIKPGLHRPCPRSRKQGLKGQPWTLGHYGNRSPPQEQDGGENSQPAFQNHIHKVGRGGESHLWQAVLKSRLNPQ